MFRIKNMGGRGASAGDTNSRILSKIVSLENKKASDDIGQYLKDNNLSLEQEYENVSRTENRTYRTLQGKDETYTETINERKETTIGVYKGNTRIGTLEEKRGKYNIIKDEFSLGEISKHIPRID